MKTAAVRTRYPRWLKRLSARVTLLEGATLPLDIVEQSKALAPDVRRLVAHCLALRAAALKQRGRDA